MQENLEVLNQEEEEIDMNATELPPKLQGMDKMAVETTLTRLERDLDVEIKKLVAAGP